MTSKTAMKAVVITGIMWAALLLAELDCIFEFGLNILPKDQFMAIALVWIALILLSIIFFPLAGYVIYKAIRASKTPGA